MPDSSPHSRTHLGNFCTMSIWFLLPLNLPVSDPEKVQVKNRGRNQGDGQNRNRVIERPTPLPLLPPSPTQKKYNSHNKSAREVSSITRRLPETHLNIELNGSNKHKVLVA